MKAAPYGIVNVIAVKKLLLRLQTYYVGTLHHAVAIKKNGSSKRISPMAMHIIQKKISKNVFTRFGQTQKADAVVRHAGPTKITEDAEFSFPKSGIIMKILKSGLWQTVTVTT